MSAEKVKKALKALRESVPEYFESRISDKDCPSDWDLPENENCRLMDEDVNSCRECWQRALGND